MRRWWRAQIGEIASAPGLRWYGVALSLVHVLTLAFWRGGATHAAHLEDPVRICWPMLPGCRAWEGAWTLALGPLTWAYVAATALALGAWLVGRVGVGYGALVAATALKFVLYTLDYREMGNYHYMPAVITLLFLFVPRKREAIRFMLVAFYLGAGVLKFNEEWLSGSALFGHPWLEGRWLVLGCAAVIGLEMVVSLGLVARDARVRYASLAAFAVFHLFSWHLVGFFYPLVMFALLSIFVLDPAPISLADLVRGRGAWSTYAALATFAVLQLPPAFARTDSALTGEGRLTALNMFDARIACHAHVVIEGDAEGRPRRTDVNDPFPLLGTRIRCEPWVYREFARSLCARRDEGVRRVRLRLLAKRSSAVEWSPTLDETRACD